MNVYSYVGNDPVNMVDPSGYAAETQGGSFLDTFSPSGGRLSDAFADHIGVPRGTDIYNMENAKSMNSAEFQGAMEANTFFTRELPMAAGAVISAAVIGPIVAPTIVNTALNPVTSSVLMSADSIFDFTDNLSGALGGPTTGLPPVTSAGHAGFLLGTGLNELSNNLDSKSTSDSFHD